jgi:coenzyme F420-reducing hydrogenase alpha subunit
MTNEREMASFTADMHESAVNCIDELERLNIGSAKARLHIIMNKSQQMHDNILKSYAELQESNTCTNCIHSYVNEEINQVCCGEGIETDNSLGVGYVEETFACRYHVRKGR